MKKFMLLVLVALLYGCATENPHYRNVQTVTATVAGAYAGYNLLGGSVIGGVTGAIVGHETAKGAQWKPGDDEVEYVYENPGAYSPRYSSCGGARVYCDTTPKQGMAPPRPGMCNDPDSGGETTYEDLVRRAQKRAGCNDSSGHRPQQTSYSQVVYPQNMWGRHENRQKTADKREKKEAYDGPTINDYMSPRWDRVIPVNCRTGNYGRDSNCLYSEAEKLKTRQEACEADSRKCRPGFNFGQMAWFDRKLAGDLRRAQDKYKE